MSLSAAIGSVLRSLRSSTGERIEYRRAGRVVRLRALIGRTATETTLETGFVSVGQLEDFLVGAADLDIDGVRFLPERGDQLVRVELPGQPVFQVCPNGEDCYRFSDPARSQIRIHTQAMGVDP
ncbi:MAG: hypothetical protein KF774_17795 [Planctomyces sp.]|nr:hypothetical protein [Planctomyces sp.]